MTKILIVEDEAGLVTLLKYNLEKQGYKCVKNVGNSEFKIDIAVVNPYDADSYFFRNHVGWRSLQSDAEHQGQGGRADRCLVFFGMEHSPYLGHGFLGR